MPYSPRLLDRVQIAKPCPASWDAMKGDGRVRFCDLCQKNVFNLSGMRAADAEAVVRGSGGNLCVGLYRRADGTILTQDCPVGLAALRRRAALWVASAVGAVGLMVASALGAKPEPKNTWGEPRKTSDGKDVDRPSMVLGAMRITPSTTPASGAPGGAPEGD